MGLLNGCFIAFALKEHIKSSDRSGKQIDSITFRWEAGFACPIISVIGLGIDYAISGAGAVLTFVYTWITSIAVIPAAIILGQVLCNWCLSQLDETDLGPR